MSGGIGLTRVEETREQLLVTGQGLIAQVAARELFTNTTAIVSGTIYGSLVGLKAGDLVTNVHLCFSSGFTGFSGVGAVAGIYTSAGVKVAETSDQQALLAAAGFKTFPLTSAYSVPSSGAYYLAFLAITSGAGSVYRITTSAIAANQNVAVGSGVIPHGVMASQTSLVSSATFVTTNSFAPWMGCS